MRSLVLFFVVSTAACTSLTEPDEIMIIKDSPKPPAAAPEPAPQPSAPAQGAAMNARGPAPKRAPNAGACGE